MKLGIMQPYFFPYVGYFQLMNAVDQFVVYDNIEFTRGWINRNRILLNGSDALVTLPLRKDSDYLPIVARRLADSWDLESVKLINRIKESYRKAPSFTQVMPLVEECLAFQDRNLFNFLHHSLMKVNRYLGITTQLVVSSTINIDHSLKAEEKVLAICRKMGCTDYLNPIGGRELYSKERFMSHEIVLHFLKPDEIQYKQFREPFVPWLSIVDVLMFNSIDRVQQYLSEYSLE